MLLFSTDGLAKRQPQLDKGHGGYFLLAPKSCIDYHRQMKWNPSAAAILRGFALCGAWVVVVNVLAVWNYSQTGEISGVSYVAALVVAMIYWILAVWAWISRNQLDAAHDREMEDVEATLQDFVEADDLDEDGLRTVRTLTNGIWCQPSPAGFEEWLTTQPRALQAAASSCPPGTYLNDGDIGMIMGYEQDDAGKVWVTFCIPSMEERRLHINQLQPVDVDAAEE